MLVAFSLRLINLGFGLPSMYDPDEPIFMITALKLIKEGTFNPGWFGHPGTTTIYLLALVDIVVVAGGLVLGVFRSFKAVPAYAFAHPGIMFVPGRLAMVVLSLACIFLTYRVGRRLFDRRTGLIAAALLAINPLHITWSQVIRTDIHASVFMLGSILFAIRIAKHGRARDYVLAGAFVGFAMATKWPSAIVFVAIIGASTTRIIDHRPAALREMGKLSLAALAAPIGLFIASPYIFLDWRTVLSNVGGEVQHGHLGHNGGGMIANLRYYVVDQIGGSMGLVGLAFAIVGVGFAVARNRMAAWTILPVLLAFLLLICSQAIIWSRWVLPVLPLMCVFAAVGVGAAGLNVARLLRGSDAHTPILATLGVAMLVAVPSMAGAWAGAHARENDTRDQAAAWAQAHIPPGSTLIVEHLALKLRGEPWTIKFPLGAAGCVDGVKLLKGDVRYDRVQKERRSSPIVDLGNVSVSRLASCRGDFLMLSYYDLYRAEAARYPAELATYRQILTGGQTVALFKPGYGVASGPVVRIVSLPQRSAGQGRQ